MKKIVQDILIRNGWDTLEGSWLKKDLYRGWFCLLTDFFVDQRFPKIYQSMEIVMTEAVGSTGGFRPFPSSLVSTKKR